jgi:LysR family transcriptional regulator, regulator for bpeEF and oprC
MASDVADLLPGVVPFVHVAEALSFRRAAEQLGVSTAAVSKAVTRLEGRLGVKLLGRTSRTVALTAEGAQFLARARDALDSLRAGRAQVERSRRQPRGVVRVATTPILGPRFVAAMPALATRYPELEVRLELGDRLSNLLAEGIDVAIRAGARTSSTLVSRVLHRPRWITVAAPAYLARHGTPAKPAQLAHHRCVRFVDPRGRLVPWSFRDAPPLDQTTHLDLAGSLTVTSGDLLPAAALAGLGLVQVMDFMVRDRLHAGELVEVLAELAAEAPPIHAVTTPERSRSANVRAIIELGQAMFGQSSNRSPARAMISAHPAPVRTSS